LRQRISPSPQPVVAESEVLAGDRDLRDVASAAFGDALESDAQRSAAGGIFRAASVRAQRSAGLPWRVMCPRPALPSALRTVGASPAHAHNCHAVGKRLTSPTSAIISIAV
jgi:hypothetical protein